MRLLADENVDRPIVLWLREQGHDVVEAAAAVRGASDAELIRLSRSDNRVLMTFDRDMGRIIQSDRLPHPGVIYLRLRGVGPELWNAFKRIWPRIEPGTCNHFVTVRNDRVRRRPLQLIPES